ncbi:MAG: tyrosine-type recombinase/integrase [Syntrophobacteraceae bacterium]
MSIHVVEAGFGSWLAMSGAHPRVIMDLMGHGRMEQTMRYTHLAPDQKRQAELPPALFEAACEVIGRYFHGFDCVTVPSPSFHAYAKGGYPI